MKLQSLAVIFVIIILPISLVMSEYIQLQLDSVVLMSSYDAKLNDATYDAMRAYQLNEQNTTTDGVKNEKIRDIKASINSFYASLSNSLGTEGYTEDDLKPYVPAIVYTLYDGYYIYGPYRNSENVLEYGIKPYITYSEIYENPENDDYVVINYTLDNYITVYGQIENTPIQKGGFVVNPDEININDDVVTIGDVTIEPELLTETTGLAVQNDSHGIPDPGVNTYKYVNYWSMANKEKNENTHIESRHKIINYGQESDGTPKWYELAIGNSYHEYKVLYEDIVPDDELEELNDYKDKSAVLYYKSAKQFSEWLEDKLDWVQIPNSSSSGVTYAKSGSKFFDDMTNIEDEDSIFNIHRKEVMKKSIESNLKAAIESYKSTDIDSFKMPKIAENEWDKILNNVSIISFLQNIATKNNYQKYSGYCVITNNQNKDYVDPTQIYIQGSEVHNISCKKLKNESWGETLGEMQAYKNTDFLRKNVFDETGESRYYYKHNYTFCYDCLVNTQASNNESIEDILQDVKPNVRNKYYTALAREKYNVNMNWKDWYYEEPEDEDPYTFEIYYEVSSTGQYTIKTSKQGLNYFNLFYSNDRNNIMNDQWKNGNVLYPGEFSGTIYVIAQATDSSGMTCTSKVLTIP